MSYNAIVLADSISFAGHRVITLEVTFPRLILAEVNTHRMLTKSSASSRAIPVSERIRQILDNPFVPLSFSKNRSGMQASEDLDGASDLLARECWMTAAGSAAAYAAQLSQIGVHKQHANRLLEPYAWHTAVITSTEWANWDALRISKMAQPEFYKLAGMMLDARTESTPQQCGDGEWHLPYVHGVPASDPANTLKNEIIAADRDPVKVSIGRCAAVSYQRQSSESDWEKDEKRCDSLVGNGHMAPLEHALRPMTAFELEMFKRPEFVWDASSETWTRGFRDRYFLGNSEGWVQYRKLIPGEDVYRGE